MIMYYDNNIFNNYYCKIDKIDNHCKNYDINDIDITIKITIKIILIF